MLKTVHVKSLPVCILLMIGVICVCGGETGVGNSQYFAKEPTVTRKEAEILARVDKMMDNEPEKAVELLSQSITLASSAALDFALGAVYAKKGDMEQAAAGFRNALQKLPEFARARTNLASVYLRMNKPEQAIHELKLVLLSGRKKGETLALMGYALLQQNRAVHAETAYRQALLFNPDDDTVLLGLAECLLVQKQYREAKTLLDSLLEKRPFDRRLWMIYSNACIALGQPRNALVSLECAMRLDIASPEALATLGDLYMNMDQPRDALRAYTKAFSSGKPSPARVLRAAQGFIMTRNLKEARAFLNKADKLFQENPDSFTSEQYSDLCYTQAQYYQMKGDTGSAASAYGELLRKDPLNGKALLALGDIHREAGEREQAQIMYERAERIQETKAEALVRLSQIEIDRKQYKKAVRLLESAEVIQPDPRIARFLKQVKRLAELAEGE